MIDFDKSNSKSYIEIKGTGLSLIALMNLKINIFLIKANLLLLISSSSNILNLVIQV